jgi:hypothetical protein
MEVIYARLCPTQSATDNAFEVSITRVIPGGAPNCFKDSGTRGTWPDRGTHSDGNLKNQTS